MIPGSPQYNPYPHQAPPPSPQPTIIVQQGKSSGGGVAAIILISVVVIVALTIVISGFLYVWASNLASENSEEGYPQYQFEDRDAPGSMTAQGGDNLVHIKLTSFANLNWDEVQIDISIDGGLYLGCIADDSNSDCTYSSDNDSWNFLEEITISEGNQNNLCDGSNGGCDVNVRIVKITEPGGGDVLAILSAYADANQ